MTRDNLKLLEKRFADYCKSFALPNFEDQKNLLLKEQHTYNVCKNIVKIAKAQSLNDGKIILAEATALFHDIGRFPQYAKFRTFRDSISINHGCLGADTLVEEGVLHTLQSSEQETIIQAVKFHNAFTIPDLENPETILFLKMVRDADKLDIWRIFVEYYEGSEEDRASAICLGLPDMPTYSHSAISSIYEKHVVSQSDVKTLNDFKLLQLSWVYDLNFGTSFRILLEKNYLNRIAAELPHTDEIRRISVILQNFAHHRAFVQV